MWRGVLRWLTMLVAGATTLGSCGSNIDQAVVDGFYGGITDTIAAVLSALLLGLLGAGPTA